MLFRQSFVVALFGMALPWAGTGLLEAMLVMAAANMAAGAVCATDLFNSRKTPYSKPFPEIDFKIIHSYAINVWLTTIANSLVGLVVRFH